MLRWNCSFTKIIPVLSSILFVVSRYLISREHPKNWPKMLYFFAKKRSRNIFWNIKRNISFSREKSQSFRGQKYYINIFFLYYRYFFILAQLLTLLISLLHTSYEFIETFSYIALILKQCLKVWMKFPPNNFHSHLCQLNWVVQMYGKFHPLYTKLQHGSFWNCSAIFGGVCVRTEKNKEK